jgi:hypothetical protein
MYFPSSSGEIVFIATFQTEYENDITSDNTGDNTKEFTIPLTGVATVS